MDDFYSVLIVRGNVFEISDIYNDVIRFGDLGADEALDLTRKTVDRGYTACIWRQGSDADGEDAECGEKA